MRKRIVILGSTGSIGINTLKVVERFPDRFEVLGLTAYNNIRLLEQQANRYKPKYVAVGAKGIGLLKKGLNSSIKVLNAEEDLEELVSLSAVDIVVIGMRGSAALKPFLKAVRCGKTIAPANKEAIVIAGEILMEEARRYRARIIPVDSEQSAIFQCLEGRNQQQIDKIYLTASGGALLTVPKSRFDKISVKAILKHPRWKMGRKITVDSATLMNKGFEVIEAVRLFNVKSRAVEILVHPEAIIHSMVGFKDGSIIAQLGVTDMRLPIQYALTYPERLGTGLKNLDFYKLRQLTFDRPDTRKFPALGLAFYAAEGGGTLPSVLNAADEEAVDAFLCGCLKFTGIYDVVEKVVRKHRTINRPSLDDILAADQWAREAARNLMCKVKS